MRRYRPTRLRYRPCHLFPCRGWTFPWNGSCCIRSIARPMVTWWSRGSALNCLVASGESRIVHGVVIRLETELLLHVIPGHMLALFELCLALADDLFFLGRKYIIGVDELLGLDDHLALGARDLDEIALVQAEFVADLLGNHDLASLAQFTNRHNRSPNC